MLLCFKIRPEIALFGSIAFTLSSYMIIGIAAGHNARIGTAALLPLIVGGVHLCIHRNRNLGFIITAVALALQLRLNHLQITYYTLIILIFYGSGNLIYYYSKNKLKYFAKRIGVLVIAALLAVGTFFGEIWAILEYSDVSIRGKSELSSDVTGLDKDYAFQYSNGFFEPLTLFIPNILGYYLNEGLGQSTKSDSKQPVERTVIELRYGFNILEPHLVPHTREYDVKNIIVDEEKIPVSNYVKL